MTETLPANGRKITDLRRVGINPDFWYPVAVSATVRKEKTFAATFAGQRIALYRGAGGAVYALEDRCAHRQVPLSMGVVEGTCCAAATTPGPIAATAASRRSRTCPRAPRARR
ncbi:MAG TPA: Rieske 2Fe-2S domain-containing protein, partial [Streptosporangiaceae bacterium]|nr:Rieske 2Fe-2S domain-containing protein [Streptosporangiaceae bacterium]